MFGDTFVLILLRYISPKDLIQQVNTLADLNHEFYAIILKDDITRLLKEGIALFYRSRRTVANK